MVEFKKQDNLIFNVKAENIKGMGEKIINLMANVNRINVNIQNLTPDFEYTLYEIELNKIAKAIELYVNEYEILKEINIITDVMYMQEHGKCPAGSDSLTYAPDGEIYICPALYYEKENCANIISGNFEHGLKVPNQHLYTKDYAPLCKNCTAYQCENCSWMNQKYTNEVGISPSFQCRKAMIENKVSFELQKKIGEKIRCLNKINNDGFGDPYLKMDGAATNLGYYIV